MDYRKYANKTLTLKGNKPTPELEKKLAKILEKTHTEVYKAVAFDVDGTLTERDSTDIDIHMSSIIGKLLKRGVHVLLISGRGRGSMKEAARQIIEKSKLSSSYIRRFSCIAHNGIYWLRSPSLSFSSLLSYEELLVEKPIEQLKDIKKKILGFKDFSTQILDDLISVTEEPFENPYLLRIAFHRTLFNTNPKLLETFNGLLKDSIREYQNAFVTQATYGGNYLFNISNTNKTNALKHYAEKLGINEKSILRVGDQGHIQGNDYELLNVQNGFSVGTVSEECFSCFPVLNETLSKSLKGVEATKTLLNRLLLFPPLSLEPNYQEHQLQALHTFEELAAIRAKNETTLLIQRLKVRLHRLFDGKDPNFDFASFEYGDLFDKYSGGIILRDWEVNKLNKQNRCRELFGLTSTIFHQEKEPKLKWSMFTDTAILLRGPNYYWAMTNVKVPQSGIYFEEYSKQCLDFIRKSIDTVCVLRKVTPGFIYFKFLIGIMDNIRNILLNCLCTAYKLNGEEINKTINWKQTESFFVLAKKHTKMYLDALLREDMSWMDILDEYVIFLKKLPSVLKSISKYTIKSKSKTDKELLRKWRETDNFLENIIAVSIGLHELGDTLKTQNNNEKKSTIVLGLMYGGVELPIIAEILAKQRKMNISGGYLSISLYGNRKFKEMALNENMMKTIQEYEQNLKNLLVFSTGARSQEINNRKIILLDDNCTTCRTLELARNILVKNNAEVIGAIVVRYPATNRYAHMRFKNHGLPDPDVLLSFIRGFVSPSPYTRIFQKGTNKENAYKDSTKMFDKARFRIERYITKNGIKLLKV